MGRLFRGGEGICTYKLMSPNQKKEAPPSFRLSGVHMRSENHKIHLQDVSRPADFQKLIIRNKSCKILWTLNGGRGSEDWKKAAGWLPAPGCAGPPPPEGGVGSALRKALPEIPLKNRRSYFAEKS